MGKQLTIRLTWFTDFVLVGRERNYLTILEATKYRILRDFQLKVKGFLYTTSLLNPKHNKTKIKFHDESKTHDLII